MKAIDKKHQIIKLKKYILPPRSVQGSFLFLIYLISHICQIMDILFYLTEAEIVIFIVYYQNIQTQLSNRNRYNITFNVHKYIILGNCSRMLLLSYDQAGKDVIKGWACLNQFSFSQRPRYSLYLRTLMFISQFNIFFPQTSFFDKCC